MVNPIVAFIVGALAGLAGVILLSEHMSPRRLDPRIQEPKPKRHLRSIK